MLNLDTHILLFAFSGKLTTAEQRCLDGEQWSISAIVLWEIAKLNEIGRIDDDLDDPALEEELMAVHIWPISLHVVRALKKLDFQSDPADELIAATSLAHDIPMMTRDRRILDSRLVPLVR